MAAQHQTMSRFARLLVWIGAIPLLYLVCAAIGGAIPRNAEWREPGEGVTVHVATNGFHTGLIVPVRAAGIDWRALVQPRDLADPRYAGDYLWIGWGERAFFLGTPRWRDVRASTLIGAATGSDAVLIHVDHMIEPAEGVDARPIRLTAGQYRQLAVFVRRSFAAGHRPIPGYGPADVFYPARGRYDAVRTCNQWTGDALAAAGVRIGRWTPTSATLMQWFG